MAAILDFCTKMKNSYFLALRPDLEKPVSGARGHFLHDCGHFLDKNMSLLVKTMSLLVKTMSDLSNFV